MAGRVPKVLRAPGRSRLTPACWRREWGAQEPFPAFAPTCPRTLPWSSSEAVITGHARSRRSRAFGFMRYRKLFVQDLVVPGLPRRWRWRSWRRHRGVAGLAAGGAEPRSSPPPHREQNRLLRASERPAGNQQRPPRSGARGRDPLRPALRSGSTGWPRRRGRTAGVSACPADTPAARRTPGRIPAAPPHAAPA
jgi:hypothetical protein